MRLMPYKDDSPTESKAISLSILAEAAVVAVEVAVAFFNTSFLNTHSSWSHLSSTLFVRENSRDCRAAVAIADKENGKGRGAL